MTVILDKHTVFVNMNNISAIREILSNFKKMKMTFLAEKILYRSNFVKAKKYVC